MSWLRLCPRIPQNGVVYIGCVDGYVYSLSGSTGSILWKYYVSYAVQSSATIASDGTLYVGAGPYVHVLQ